MSTPSTFVVVGASLAGAKAVETLRTEGFEGRIVLVGEEVHRPYERPPLSKGYLAGTSEKDKIYVHPASWYADQGVDLRLGTRATGFDPAAHTVTLSDGEVVPYTKLLLTTGSTPRQLKVAGRDLAGVFTLRTVEDSEALRAAISRGGSVVVIGGGWIGLETAAAARGYGASVTIIEPQSTPLHAVLGPDLGAFYGELHREHGVDLRTGEGVREIRGAAGKVVGVMTTSGAELVADSVIVGVGIQPNVELAEQAGLVVDNGIVVDAFLRTSDPDVFAAGDVANAYSRLFDRHVRVEHWANALNGGPAAARSMLGTGQEYDRVPYFYSDQYDVGMEYSGLAVDEDQVVLRGERDKHEFVAFWLKRGKVLAGMNVNVWDVTPPIQQLIRSAARVDPERLADPSVPLDEVAPTE